MTSNCKFEYANESSIDPELICIICKSPYQDPRCTPCDHTFCAECIIAWITHNNASCPTCRQIFPISRLTQANRTVRNMLDRLLVKCARCDETTIRRENFDDHYTRTCPKIPVSCSAADNRCQWTGPQDQLENHLASCVFHILRDVLGELMSENRQLKEKLTQQQNHIDVIQDQVEQLQQQLLHQRRQNNQQQNPDDRLGRSLLDMDEWTYQYEDKIDRLWEQVNGKLKLVLKFIRKEIEKKPRMVVVFLERKNYHYYQLQNWIAKCDHRSILHLSQIPLSDQDITIVIEEAMIKKQCTGLELREDEITTESNLTDG